MKIVRVGVSVIQVFLLFAWSICTGLFVAKKLQIISVKENMFLVIPFCFFLGLTLVLVAFRLLDLIVKNVYIACYAIIVLASVLVGMEISNGELFYVLQQFNMMYAVIFCCCILGIGTLILMHWCNYSPTASSARYCKTINAHTHLGTVHTPRSILVAKVAVEEKRIPMIGINYGLPLIMTIFEVLKNPYAYFTQFIYYCFNNAMVCFFIVGYMVEYWGVSLGYAVMVAVVVMFAAEELSYRYKLCTDPTGCTNWGIVQYPDVWMMLCIFMFYLRLIFAQEVGSNIVAFSLIAFFTIICAMGWSLIAPQFSVMMVGLLVVNLCQKIFLVKKEVAISILLLAIIIVVTTIGTARLCGGMFQKKNRIRCDIDGNSRGGDISLGYNGLIYWDICKMDSSWCSLLVSKNLILIVSSLFPIIVIGVGAYEMCPNYNSWNCFLLQQLLWLFMGGFVVVYFLSAGNGASKKELYRFLAPAFVLAKIVWMGMLFCSLEKSGFCIKNIIYIGLTVYLVLISIPFHVRMIKTSSSFMCIKDTIKRWFDSSMITNNSDMRQQYIREYYTNVINEKIDKIISLQELKNKTVYIYGTGEYALEIFHSMSKDKDIHIKGFIDSNRKKWGSRFEGQMIYSPCKVARSQKNEIVIIGSELVNVIVSIFRMCEMYQLRHVMVCKNNFGKEEI